MNEPVAASQPKAVPQVNSQLSASCGLLDERLGELEEALGSVLRDPEPSKASETKTEPAVVCGLASAIAGQVERIDAACYRLRGLIDRLEL